MQNYELWSEDFKSRIVVIKGDISVNQFAMNSVQYDDLANIVDIIIHNAAHVNGIMPYDALYNSNVKGTLEIIKFAAKGKSKKVHYVSTISVLSGIVEERLLKESDFYPTGGYGHTKFMAERLLAQAYERGFHITIYRIGTVSANRNTGHFNSEAYINRLLCGMIIMKTYPFVERNFNLVPVDFVAQAIVHGCKKITESGSVYHVVNFKSKIELRKLISYFFNFGYTVSGVEYSSWYDILRRSEDNPLHPLISYFSNGFPSERMFLKSDKFEQLLLDSGIYPGAITESYITNFLASAVTRNLISKPSLEPLPEPENLVLEDIFSTK